jgi:signal transduction histidine kinase
MRLTVTTEKLLYFLLALFFFGSIGGATFVYEAVLRSGQFKAREIVQGLEDIRRLEQLRNLQQEKDLDVLSELLASLPLKAQPATRDAFLTHLSELAADEDLHRYNQQFIKIKSIESKKSNFLESYLKNTKFMDRPLKNLLRSEYKSLSIQERELIIEMIERESITFKERRDSMDDLQRLQHQKLRWTIGFLFLLNFFLLGIALFLLKRSKEKNQRAAEAVSQKEEVLNIVSHDLKNPLFSIQLSAQILERKLDMHPQLDASFRKGLSTISKASSVAVGLLQDVLQKAKVDHSLLKMHFSSSSLNELLSHAEEVIAPLAAAKGITVQTCLLDKDVSVPMDRKRIEQVLLNLFGNAIKFQNDSGKLIVNAEMDRNWVTVEVRDTGPGIPSERLDKIFDRYWQAEETHSKGTGLGLYIAKTIIEKHHGKIWVESEVSNGSVFIFSLPRNHTTTTQLDPLR